MNTPTTYQARSYKAIPGMPGLFIYEYSGPRNPQGATWYGWRLVTQGREIAQRYGYDTLEKATAALNAYRKLLAQNRQLTITESRRVKLSVQALLSEAQEGDEFEVPMHDETKLNSQQNMLYRLAMRAGFDASVTPRRSVFIVRLK